MENKMTVITETTPANRCGAQPVSTNQFRPYPVYDEWGSRYRDLKWTKQYLPQLKIVKIPHMMHGEYVMMHPQEFTKQALGFFDGNQTI